MGDETLEVSSSIPSITTTAFYYYYYFYYINNYCYAATTSTTSITIIFISIIVGSRFNEFYSRYAEV
jgi:hypothetical protein